MDWNEKTNLFFDKINNFTKINKQIKFLIFLFLNFKNKLLGVIILTFLLKYFLSSFFQVIKIIPLILHDKNLGKGAAIKNAQKKINGDCVIIQDADLEYDPNDYHSLIKPILDKSYKVVYGSRVLGKNRYQKKNFTSITRIFANHILTIVSNIVNSQSLTDAHTCYKVFSGDLFKSIKLEEDGFNFCPEITTKISNLNIEIKELPINYQGRSYKEGKKIKFYDGIEALYTIIKYKFLKKSNY